jgi:chromodomain-helicase-DNA-binding protein 1
MPDPSGLTAVSNPGGSVVSPLNSGGAQTHGSVIKGGPNPPGMRTSAIAAAVMPHRNQPGVPPPRGHLSGHMQPPPMARNFPPMMQPAQAPPRPGLQPAYPDARSPNPTIMPNGLPVMPPSSGYIAAAMMPRVPPSMAPQARPPMPIPPMPLPRPPGAPPAGMGPMGRPPGGVMRPMPGGPPVRAPDGNLYIHRPHPGGLYHKVPG